MWNVALQSSYMYVQAVNASWVVFWNMFEGCHDVDYVEIQITDR
jgi:hypothetical protein